MVCLTTFGDTKRVISQSLIIFHTFYGDVQGRGVLSRGSAYLPPHLLHTIPTPPRGIESSFTEPSLLLKPLCSVIYFLRSDAGSRGVRVQPPASNRGEDNPVFPQWRAAEDLFGEIWKPFYVQYGEGRGKKKIEDEIRVGAQAPSAVADRLEARASCSQAANPISEYSVCDIYSNG